MNQRQYQYSQQSSAQQFRQMDPRQQQGTQQQRFVPQQINPYNQQQSSGINKSESSLPKVNVQQNPYASKPAVQQQQQQQQTKGPLFLFQSEQANLNQPVVSGLLKNKLPAQQIDNHQSEEEEDEEVQNENEEEEEDDEEQEDEEQEQEDQEEENADDTEDENDEDNQIKQEQPKREIKPADKFKSVNEISAIRQEVTKINKELDKLEQEIESTLVMSRIQYESQTILDMSVSSDISYQQYLKEFEQFKQLKQSQTSLMKQ